MSSEIHDSSTCTAGLNGAPCEMCRFAREFEKSSAKSSSESPGLENRGIEQGVSEPENALQVKYGSGMTICRDCQGSGQGWGLAGICPYCHGDGKIETYEARQRRLEESLSTTIPAPDFDREWREAPRSMKDYVEREVAEKWLMRGIWLGIQYERERGLVALNGDLKEMQRMARERIGR